MTDVNDGGHDPKAQLDRLLEEDPADLYENAPMGYLSTLPDGRIVKVNRTFCAWTGRQPDQLIGTRFQDLLSVGGRVFHETHLAPLLRMQGAVREIALDVVRVDGSLLPCLLNAVEVRDEAGAPLLVRATLFEATARRRYERALLAIGGLTEKDISPVLVPNVVRGADDFASGAADTFTFAFGAPKIREVDVSVGGIRLLGLGQPCVHLGGQRLLGCLHAAIAHGFVARGVRLQLGAVHGHMPELHQSCGSTQLQDLHEQIRQGCEMALAEIRDGAEVGTVQACDRHDVDPLLTGAGELARRVDATAVAVEQERHHHAGMVGREAALLRVGVANSREVERLAHCVSDEVRQVAGWHELVHRGRQKPTLVHVPRAKGLGHEPSESSQTPAVETLTRTGS